MKKLCIVALLLLSVGTLAAPQYKGESETGSLGSEPMPITDGQGTIRVNSYGNTLQDDLTRMSFTIGGVPHLAEFGNYVSINDGPIERTEGPGWSVLVPLTIDGGVGVSSVVRSKTLQVDFVHTVVDNGGGLVDWYFTATFTNLTAEDLNVCHFPYMDYDLFSTEIGDTATYDPEDPDLGVPAIRVIKKGSSQVFLFADVGATSSQWRISEWVPLPADPLRSGLNCVTLPNAQTPFGPGDFTGAYRTDLALPAGESATVSLQMGRFQ